MSILSICDQLRQHPYDFLSAESASSLRGFFAGYGFGNSSISTPLLRAAKHFAPSSELNACTLAYLTSPDPKTSFDRLLEALEIELAADEPPPTDERDGIVLLDAILTAIEQSRTGIFLVEPTTACLYETLHGYWCGIGEFDPAAAASQRATMRQFEAWLRPRYDPTVAPWYALLRIHEGADDHGLRGFHRLYYEFLATAAVH